MIQRLSKFENLGTPSYFIELLNIINQNDSNWMQEDLSKYFLNRSIDGRRIFDGCLDLALEIGIISKSKSNHLNVDISIKKKLQDEKFIFNKIIEKLFKTLKEDNDFYEIFSSSNISYDLKYNTFQISSSAFTFKYSNFKQLLIDFEVIFMHPIHEIKKYNFNSKYKDLYDLYIVPEKRKKRIDIDELKKLLEQMQKHGDEAEIYVLDFEKKRLNNKIGIERISEYSVGEGYDIISYNSEESALNDRCIEVKSYSNTPNFYWSKKEVEVARIKKDEYFLYLINRNEIRNKKYKPLIIQDPYLNVFKSNLWIKEIEKYYFKKMN